MVHWLVMIETKDRQIAWQAWDGPGLEHLHIKFDTDGLFAHSSCITGINGLPFSLSYRLSCDANYYLTYLELDWVGETQEQFRYFISDEGQWSHGYETKADLAGCTCVDLSLTPFTNTLAILQLGLQPGEEGEIKCAYLDFDTLEFYPVQQRYTCLESTLNSSFYGYENLHSGYKTTFYLDADFIVLDYPDTFLRMS